MSSEMARALARELELYPVTYGHGHGGKHPFLTIKTQDGRSRRFVFSHNTAGRNVMNSIADLRRTLRELGVAPIEQRRVGSLGRAIVDGPNTGGA